jgi:predicted metalloprotease with PDZ domain
LIALTLLQPISLAQKTVTQPQLTYQITMPSPESHLFWVRLQIQEWQSSVLLLNMPVWTPGSYLIREYARHLQNFSARSKSSQSLRWWKTQKNQWQIETADCTEIWVDYQIYAHELSVRTNHLDSTHGYFNGAALFLYIPDQTDLPIEVSITPPDASWHVSTTLPSKLETDLPFTFQAPDFDTLVDSPVEIGTHQLYDFPCLGKPHQLAVWGQGNFDPQQAIPDICKIIETEASLFGGLPYDRYLFLLHLTGQGFGGLEHKNSCSLIYSRFGFRAPDPYHRFLQLVAHEFFHLWNIKRIRPQALEVFDYDRENYTPSLWFSEGTTSYYDLTIPFRAGIYDAKALLSHLSKEITRYLKTPGRLVQSLQESSFDAWIKLYRPDANSSNAQISYYLKGEMVSFLLDLLIRERFQNQRSLDDASLKSDLRPHSSRT